MAANVLMVAFAFWMIHVGLREDRGRPFTAGVIYFFLWTILRYIDLFGGNMLGAAMMFFSLWRNALRRGFLLEKSKELKNMDNPSQTQPTLPSVSPDRCRY